MKRVLPILASALLLGSVAASCSCSSSDPTHPTQVTEGKVKDKHAYALGEEHAAEAIAISDNQAALEDKLLEVRARISNISSKLGPQSAHDYERGFADYIRTHSDSLARIIL